MNAVPFEDFEESGVGNAAREPATKGESDARRGRSRFRRPQPRQIMCRRRRSTSSSHDITAQKTTCHT
jgi:hypothetical protein